MKLNFMLNDYESSYKDLLKKSRKPSMNWRKTRSVCINIYKDINNFNPEFMEKLFKVCKTNRAQREQYKLNLGISKSNQFFFGTKSLCMQGPTVWNALPFNIKSKETFHTFKDVNSISELL